MGWILFLLKVTKKSKFHDLQDEEYSEQEYQAVEKHEQEQETTTTEAPKRITLAVRPFRSNDDLLAALKKRRLQAKSQQQQQPKTGKFIKS